MGRRTALPSKLDVRYPVVRAAAPVHRLHFEVGTNNGVLARQIPTMAQADFDDN